MTTNPTSKQDLILNAFITLLIQGGYQSATINKTAEVAGVNPSTIFRKFTDKEGLLSAVVERHLHDLSTIFDGMVVIGDVEKDLVTMSRIYQEFQANHQEIVLVGVQESFRMPEMSRAVEEIPLQFKQMLRQYFTDMRAQHKISDQVDIEAATMNMIWLNFGYFLAAIRFENPDLVTPPEDFYDKQIRFFAKSLAV